MVKAQLEDHQIHALQSSYSTVLLSDSLGVKWEYHSLWHIYGFIPPEWSNQVDMDIKSAVLQWKWKERWHCMSIYLSVRRWVARISECDKLCNELKTARHQFTGTPPQNCTYLLTCIDQMMARGIPYLYHLSWDSPTGLCHRIDTLLQHSFLQVFDRGQQFESMLWHTSHHLDFLVNIFSSSVVDLLNPFSYVFLILAVLCTQVGKCTGPGTWNYLYHDTTGRRVLYQTFAARDCHVTSSHYAHAVL